MPHFNSNFRSRKNVFKHMATFYLKTSMIILVLAFAAGCTNQAMNSTMNSWQNQPISQVIAEWGQPSEELKVSGKHLFIWNTIDGKCSPPVSQNLPHSPDTRSCVRLLEVNKTGNVISGAWDGNNCPGFFSGWAR